ncbi:tetratricopeptide repeat protein [Microlunatus speluncae]|uniref:tetratricopeptide repeat protein n=1 Tax=Microlunatus speluncae TaxID=2594267 RepID=UPI0012663427|nr:tetratricopeptide repeat protein [Microlunatus speluncae]
MSSSSFNPRGAVDLSQLAEQAKQRASGGAPRPGGAAGGSYVVEVSEQTFEADVIRPSVQHPVVVEFYSPRVSTGQQLSDTLAAAAAEAGGKYLVARLNVDAAPQIASQLGLQAVPTVVGVVGGQLVPLFQGVLPADQVKAALDQLVKAAVANGIVGRAEPVGGGPVDEDAEAEPDPRFAEADAALERGDFAAAEAEFDKLLAANPADAEAKAGKAQAGLLARSANVTPEVVLAAAAAPDAELQVQLDAADVELVAGQADEAFARLIEQIKRRAGDERDQVRLRLLDLFETLGNADPRVQKARRNLMAALF